MAEEVKKQKTYTQMRTEFYELYNNGLVDKLKQFRNLQIQEIIAVFLKRRSEKYSFSDLRFKISDLNGYSSNFFFKFS